MTTGLASDIDIERGFNRLHFYLYSALLAALTLLLHVIDARPAHAEFEFTPTGATAAVAPGQSATVSGTDGRGLRVRSGPAMSHKIVTTLNEGTTVQIAAGPVSDGEEDWFQISTGTGTKGWAVGKYLASPTAMRSMSTVQGQRVFLAKVTAYADGTGGVPHGAKTYSGTKTRWGVVAVDPKVVPIGSTLQIEGYEGVTFVAEDVGGGIKGESLDIWLPNAKDARSYGTQYRKVTVLREGPAR